MSESSTSPESSQPVITTANETTPDNTTTSAEGKTAASPAAGTPEQKTFLGRLFSLLRGEGKSGIKIGTDGTIGKNGAVAGTQPDVSSKAYLDAIEASVATGMVHQPNIGGKPITAPGQHTLETDQFMLKPGDPGYIQPQDKVSPGK